ncbi:MAG: hypothetical protein ABW122_13560, partial [Ilumatobacteraceae bacterium]
MLTRALSRPPGPSAVYSIQIEYEEALSPETFPRLVERADSLQPQLVFHRPLVALLTWAFTEYRVQAMTDDGPLMCTTG